MKALTRALLRSIAATAVALPFAVSAQTTTTTPMSPTSPTRVTPSDQPTSQTERDAQTRTGQATKYGTQETDNATTPDSSKMHKGAKHDTMKKPTTSETSDPSTTYPAPSTPTK